ncbi:acyl carrier protein [uncultured Jannaschia sp.]|uniref:acyl carrier protein n=1 Tax=uncultured Jannaschia sp. TaxID=293347 RepID=UPI00260E1BD1|nr:acyl carrier protein [uncultured Jannaschia sp.]
MDDRMTQLAETVCDEIDRDPDDVPVDADRDNVDGWDSLAHLRIVTAVESRFGVRLTMQQISEARSISDLARMIEL